MHHSVPVEIIKKKFVESGSRAKIPKLRGEDFDAEIVENGIRVSNLGSEPLIEWKAFEEAVKLMRFHGGRAQKGNAMVGKLGDKELPLDSLEGHIAYEVYGKREGETVFRRIAPVAAILIWAGLCENEPGALRLKSALSDDADVIRFHWNYFLALEEDVDRLSRYIAFDQGNFACYSVEMARLLLSVCAEVDVVAKVLCKEIDGGSKPEGIEEYRKRILSKYSSIYDEAVYTPRFRLRFTPWASWAQGKSPEWWKAYNAVKHERMGHFEQANLLNVLNSVCGLLLMILYLRKAQIANMMQPHAVEEPVKLLRPHCRLLRLDERYYVFYKMEQ